MDSERDRERRPITSTRRSLGRCHCTSATCSSTADAGTWAHCRRPTPTLRR